MRHIRGARTELAPHGCRRTHRTRRSARTAPAALTPLADHVDPAWLPSEAFRPLGSRRTLFARRATAPAHFGVGLRDTVWPPSGAYAAYNRYGELTGRDPLKEIHAYPFDQHEGGDAVHVRRQPTWLDGVLGS